MPKHSPSLIFVCLLIFLNACTPAVATAPAAWTPSPVVDGEGVLPVVTQIGVQSTPTTPTASTPTSTPAIASVLAPTTSPTPAPGAAARAYVLALSDGIGPRVAGSTAEAQAADTIHAVFVSLGYPAAIEPFYVKDPSGSDLTSANVTALKPGSSTCRVIVGAHYDSIKDGRGADDNASGVAVMLAAAESLKNRSTPCSIEFVAFGAEEIGLQGSKVYAKKKTQQEIADMRLMVNLDSLLAGDFTYVYGDQGKGGAARDWLLETARQQDLPLITQPGANPKFPAGTTGDWSDHAPFQDRGVPIVYFESTNWTLGRKDGFTQTDPRLGDQGSIWHTPDDTLAYIDQTFPGRADQHLELFTTLLIQLLTDYDPS